MIKKLYIPYGDPVDHLKPIRLLVAAIFERALRDALFVYGSSSWHSPKHRDDAIYWLTSDSTDQGSAHWWAEMVDAHQIWAACLKALQENNGDVIKNYRYMRVCKR